MVKIKRAYEKWDKQDGYRVLVDRLWPRGISKEKAHVDVWMKDIAPSTELRKWFHHDPGKWKEFVEKYKEELTGKKEVLDQLQSLVIKNRTVTLVYGAKDTAHNQAVVLITFCK